MGTVYSFDTGEVLSLQEDKLMNTIDGESVRLGFMKSSSVATINTIRSRVGNVQSADYMFEIFQYFLAGKRIIGNAALFSGVLPYPYRIHISKMNANELELLLRFVEARLDERNQLTMNMIKKRELQILRTYIIRAIANSVLREAIVI